VSDERDREPREGGLTPGDPLGDPLPPPPEPPPLPEEPLGPPSMADEPPDSPLGPPSMADEPAAPAPPAQPAPPPPPPGYGPPQQPPPPPQQPPSYAPPAGAPPPPPYAPPPPAYPPQSPYQQPPQPGYPPQTGYQPPPYVPPPPKPKGPHGQPIFNGVECATWGSRVGAYLLDFLFGVVIPVAIGIPLAASGVSGLDTVGAVIILAAIIIGFPVCSAIVESRSGAHNGQTWGKQIVGIRVIRDGGETVGFGYAFLREFLVRWLLIGFIGGLFFIPPLLDLLWPIWDESNRALHDMVVNSHVVRADAPPSTPMGV
jgi:uncharacterized RDD family membrane protein YckC